MQTLRLNQKRNIYGMGLSFDALTSKVKINEVTIRGDPMSFKYPAAGTVQLKNTYITANPFFGKNFNSRRFMVDLLAGADISFVISSKENGKTTTRLATEAFGK